MEMKTYLKQYVVGIDDPIAWIDVGTDNQDRTDYPLFAEKVIKTIQSGEAQLGILLCGTGIGMAIAANRFKNMRAGVVWNEAIARRVKEEDNVNVLVLPSDFVDNELAVKICNAWLAATFKGGRYQERLDMINQF